jgi:hypothetical protein
MKKSILTFAKAFSFAVLVMPFLANANSETNSAPQSDAVVVESSAPASVVELTNTNVEKKSNPVSNVVQSKKQVIKDVVSKIKEVKKSEKADKANGLPSDKNLKFAIIFGIIGVACLLLEAIIGLGGAFWIIGSILLVVALVFLILWAVNQ